MKVVFTATFIFFVKSTTAFLFVCNFVCIFLYFECNNHFLNSGEIAYMKAQKLDKQKKKPQFVMNQDFFSWWRWGELNPGAK